MWKLNPVVIVTIGINFKSEILTALHVNSLLICKNLVLMDTIFKYEFIYRIFKSMFYLA